MLEDLRYHAVGRLFAARRGGDEGTLSNADLHPPFGGENDHRPCREMHRHSDSPKGCLSMNLHGQKYGGMILPEMMRWLWRDHAVSTDPKDMVERSFRMPAVKGRRSIISRNASIAPRAIPRARR